MSLAFSSSYPSISPSTIAVGAIYSHATSFITSRPVFGALFTKAQRANTPEEVFKSQEAASAAVTYSSSLLSSGLQSYAVASLLKLTGTTSYKAASIIGSLLFAVSAGPQFVSSLLIQKQPADIIVGQVISNLLDTVGLSLVLTWASGNPALDNVATFHHK